MIDFQEIRLRSNPFFRLVSLDQVEEKKRQSFASLAEEPDFYGLLVPPDHSSAPMKSVSKDAALLFLTLHQPARVPHLLSNLFGANLQERMRQLVLDGVFEMEWEGGFISGAAAIACFGNGTEKALKSKIAQLSAAAISYAATIEGLSVGEIATRLYLYNRAPCSAPLQRKFADDSQLLSYLYSDTATARDLESHWKRDVKQGSWLMWEGNGPLTQLAFKLYISPDVEHLPEMFRAAVAAFVRVKCTHFKVGRTAFGLLRPDKFVAYFSNLEQLQEAAEMVRASAAAISAQGVPFTGAIDYNGLVSWGMDPPRFEQVLPWQEHQSWRQWVAERIAVYTLAAKESKAESVPDFVLQRVRLDGIDPANWSPNLAIWRGRAAE